MARDGLQPVERGLGEGRLGRVEEVRVGPLAATADATAQLVQLREPEAVGPLDDEGVGVGDVEAGLDDRRAHEDVEPLLPEVEDDLLEAVLAHLPVGHGDAGLGHELADAGRGLLDRRHLVVDEEDLPLAQQLAPDGRGERLLVVGADVGEHRVALLGRGLQRRHLADAGHRHLERARDRGGRHREDVDRGAQRLELLLVLDAEALLLVDDDEPEVLEPHLLGQDAVGADDEVDRPRGEAVEHGLGLAVALEARQGAHDDREAGIPLGEGVDVLLDEQGRRAQHGHLLAVLDRLERRPHRDLGLAVADVAADEAVHRHRALHVGLDLVDGAQLVGRLDVREGVLELALPRGVGRERVPARGHPRGVQADQLGGDLLDVAPGPALGLVPVGAAHLVEAGLLAADVAGHLVELVGGHVEAVAGLAALGRGVLDDEVLAGGAADGALHHLDEPAHAVLLVDDEVARPQLEGVDLVAAPRRHPAHVLGRRSGAGGRPGEVGLGEDREARAGHEEAGADAAGGDRDDAGCRVGALGDEPARDVVLGEHLGDALGQAGPLGGDEHRPVVGDEAAQLGDGLLGVAAERR